MSDYVDLETVVESLAIPKTTLQRLEAIGMPVQGRGRAKRYNLNEVIAWMERTRQQIKGMEVGRIYRNNEIANAFGCATQGGMRRSHLTHTLVIFSDHAGADYEDKWTVDENGEDILLYVGMGKSDRGDQNIDFGQNIILKKSNENGVGVYLFEAYERSQHMFRGRVRLVAEPYQDTQAGRLVWIFPLKIVDKDSLIPEEVIEKNDEQKRKEAERLSSKALLERAKKVSGQSRRIVKSQTYVRDAYVAEHTKRRANGTCDLCGKPAPFNDKNGNPYLESHHVHWLSRGGEDTIYNTVALDPSCHKKIHVLDDAEDYEVLKKRIDYYRLSDERGLISL